MRINVCFLLLCIHTAHGFSMFDSVSGLLQDKFNNGMRRLDNWVKRAIGGIIIVYIVLYYIVIYYIILYCLLYIILYYIIIIFSFFLQH